MSTAILFEGESGFRFCKTKDLISSLWSSLIHSQKRASCSKSAADLLQVAVIKPMSGCVRIACSSLMTTSLLQVVNRLAASCDLQACCKLRTADLLQIANCRLAASCELQACCKLRTADLLQVVEIGLAYHIDKTIKKHKK